MIKKKAGGGYRLAADPMPPVDIMQGRYESLMCAASGRCKEYADIDGWRVIRHAKSKRQGASIRTGSKKAKATV